MVNELYALNITFSVAMTVLQLYFSASRAMVSCDSGGIMTLYLFFVSFSWVLRAFLET